MAQALEDAFYVNFAEIMAVSTQETAKADHVDVPPVGCVDKAIQFVCVLVYPVLCLLECTLGFYGVG